MEELGQGGPELRGIFNFLLATFAFVAGVCVAVAASKYTRSSMLRREQGPRRAWHRGGDDGGGGGGDAGRSLVGRDGQFTALRRQRQTYSDIDSDISMVL